MKKIFILMFGFLLIAVNLYAAGDLIVEGNVGIGTTSPITKLDVNGGLRVNNVILGTTDLNLFGDTYSSLGVTLKQNGNVGIGTTTPATTLDVQGNITILAGSDIRPSANSTTAINIAQANGTYFVTFDTTNKKVGFFNSIGAIPATTLGADMYLTTIDVSGSRQMFRALLTQQGVNTTFNRIFQTGNYAIRIDGASTAGYFYGMTGAGQLNHSSADVERLFGVKATSYANSSGITGHVDLGGGVIAEVGIVDSDWDEAVGLYINAFTKGTGLADFAYGIHLKKQTIGTTNAGIVLDGDGAGADIVFGPNREARIYSTSGRLYAQDQLGNQTIISPHDPETGEWVFYSKNVKTGKVVRVDMEKLVKAVERLTGEKFMVETMEKIEQ